MAVPTFPPIDPAERRRRLAPPTGRIRVVIDTDAANEIDDQFALAWAFTSRDRFDIEGVTAVPYSFGIYRDDLIRTRALRDAGTPLPRSCAPLAGWVGGFAPPASTRPRSRSSVPPRAWS